MILLSEGRGRGTGGGGGRWSGKSPLGSVKCWGIFVGNEPRITTSTGARDASTAPMSKVQPDPKLIRSMHCCVLEAVNA